MVGKILGAWRIISGTGIYNRQLDTLRLRLIASLGSGRIKSFVDWASEVESLSARKEGTSTSNHKASVAADAWG